ncbi:MAG: PulJ/GspJ family protein [Burkholderiaceae bacterium]
MNLTYPKRRIRRLLPEGSGTSRARPGVGSGAGSGSGAGFTLVELLVATALLAIVALLSWRGLDSVLQSRDRIESASDELKSLSMAFAQIDEDLRKSWPVRLLVPGQLPLRFVIAGETNQVQIELLRESGGNETSTQIQPVVWRLRDGVLERGFGPWRSPQASAAQEGLVWQPLLAGGHELKIQGFVRDRGWQDASTLAAQPATASPGAPGSVPPVPVTGVLVRVIRAEGRALERIVPVSD